MQPSTRAQSSLGDRTEKSELTPSTDLRLLSPEQVSAAIGISPATPRVTRYGQGPQTEAEEQGRLVRLMR
jgi:hypothetical protein